MVLGGEADASGNQGRTRRCLRRVEAAQGRDDRAGGVDVLGAAPLRASLDQGPGDQDVAIRRVVAVRDVRIALLVPLPGREAAWIDVELPLGPAPDLVESGAVAGLDGDQHAVALAFAVADLVDIVDHAAGPHEALLVLVPRLLQPAGRQCCRRGGRRGSLGLGQREAGPGFGLGRGTRREGQGRQADAELAQTGHSRTPEERRTRCSVRVRTRIIPNRAAR